MARITIDDLDERKQISKQEMQAAYGGILRPRLGRPGTDGQGFSKFSPPRTNPRYLGRPGTGEPHFEQITNRNNFEWNDRF